MGGVVEDIQGGLGKFVGDEFANVLTTAALTAAAVYTGGAALGGLGALGGTVAEGVSLGSAMHAAGTAAATSGAGIASAASTGIAGGMQEHQIQKQEAAQEDARQKAEAARRDAEIIRKRALLAEQTSTMGRTQAARTVRNNLQGLSRNTMLGGASERLGG
jgi:hypothetical protein